MSATTLPAPIVDTHAHLDDAAFGDDLDAVLSGSRAVGVRHFINIGYSPESWESSRALQERYPDISVALGLHPQQATQFCPDLARELSRALVEFGAVAVGETGFDFARSRPSFKEQELAFRGQLEIASDLGLPTIIHQRDAEGAVIAELDRWPELAPIVLHSFDGTRLLADWAVNRGCFVGIGGLATRHGSDSLRNVLSVIPVDRLLLETDAPYLSPPSADRRNTPGNLPVIARILAPLWGLTDEELRRTTSENAGAVFRLSGINEVSKMNTNEHTPQAPVTDRHI